MYLITFQARINRKSKAAKEFDDVDGAFINCWINFKDYKASEELAKILIKGRGFIPEKKTDARMMRKRGLKTKKDRQFYAEALKNGYTLVFHLWTKDAPDADADDESEEKTFRW